MYDFQRDSRVMRTFGVFLALSIFSVNALADGWMGTLVRDIIKGVIVGLTVHAITTNAKGTEDKTRNPAPVRTDEDTGRLNQTIADNYGRFARKHFEMDSKCSTENVIHLYGDTVYYENIEVDRAYIRRVKEMVCRRFSDDLRLLTR